MTGDLLLVNATVRPMVADRPVASAVAVRGGRIAHVGDEPGARAAAGARASVLDCRGGLLLPGLVDAHLHFRWFAESLTGVDVGVTSRGEAIERVRARAVSSAARGRSNTWITGSGWDHNRWDRLPNKEDLDRAAPGRPVALKAKSGHALWASSAALAAAGIGGGTPEPAGGRIARDGSGEPTGIIYENAMALVQAAIPKPTPADLAAAMRRAQELAWRSGLTGIHDFDGTPALQAFQLLEEAGALGLRVLKGIPREQLGEAISLGLCSGFGGAWLRIGPVKLFADGALGSRTAWMLEPFEGTGDRGIPTMTPEVLLSDISRASAAGLACAVHAIGDAANRAVLDAFEAAGPGAAQRPPHRIEHVQLLDPGDLGRLARLGIVASMQPVHATADIDIADRWWGGRCATAYAWRSLLEAGTMLAFGSDCPVEDVSPVAGIHAAVTRRRADGSPGPEGWHPEQRLTVGEAVRAYTAGAAAAGGRGTELGSIEIGRLADLTLLAEDIFAIDPHEIRNVTVRATITGGILRFLAD